MIPVHEYFQKTSDCVIIKRERGAKKKKKILHKRNSEVSPVQVENSLLECGHFYVLSRFFVFWWDIAGLPNTQLIIPLIIHNVGDYSDKNIQFPQCTHPGTHPSFFALFFLSGSSNVSDVDPP